MTEYTKKVVIGGSLVFIFIILAALFGYLVRLAIARALSPVEFGLIYSIFALFGIFSIFQNMGLSEALVKYLAEFRIGNQSGKIKSAIIFTFTSQLATAFILSAVFWILAPYLAEHYFKNDLAINGIRLYSIAIFLSPVENLFLSIFRGYQKQIWYSASNLARMVFIFVATVALLSFSKTIFSPILAYVLVYLLSFCVYLPYSLSKMFPNFFKTKTEKFKVVAKKLFYFGIPVVLTAVSATVISYTDTIMITYFKTLEDVALYSAAIPTAGLLWFFGSALAIVLLPLSSEIWKRKHSHVMGEGINLLYKYGIIIVIPLVILMFVFPDLILRILFGQQYSAGANVLKILSFAAVFFTIGQINASILSGIGKPKINAKITAIAAVLNIIGNIFLIPIIGISGAAISTAISFAIMGVFGTTELKKHIPFKFPVFTWIKTIICSAIFIAVMLLFKNVLTIELIPKIIISLIS
ncbi:flippase, partial [Candidatus Woesearchaeota archaeon]|nr:flippase [Candidatus Woesearchaeota archaeon]